MADFQPFNLGQVLQTAEAIKASRSQATTDRLREQYLGEQIQGMRADRERQGKIDTMTFGKERAQQEYARAGYIIDSQTPKNLIESQYQDIQKMIVDAGHDWASMTDDQLKQTARMIQAKAGAEAGISPIKSEQIDGATVISQGGEYKGVVSGKSPRSLQSWDEYVLAQKDPAFARFLESRKGKGLSVTLPDGTVVEMGGDGAKVGASELAKPTINNLQETIVKSTDRLDRLNQTLRAYNPEFLRAKGLLKANSTKLQDFVGMDISPDQRQFLDQYTEFRANAAQDFNQTLKELSGAAVTGNEYERAQQASPSANDRSPVEFEAKARATTKFITRAIMRANWALKNGIGVQSVDELSKRMPLEGIDGVYEARANQLWQELGGTPETKAQAIQRANQEFGLAK